LNLNQPINGKKVLIGGAFAIFVFAIAASNINSATNPPTAAETAAAAAKSAARDTLAVRAYEAAQGAKILRAGMRNPDSFQLITVGDMRNGAICYEFRSQNGFGGMSAGHGSMVKNKVYSGEQHWRTDCGGKGGTDITGDVKEDM
jgi:hypothetical protein